MTNIEIEITKKANVASKEHDGSADYRCGYYDGAKWMQERMIEKAGKWLSNNMFNSINNGVIINGYCVSDFIGRFKQAMQDESE